MSKFGKFDKKQIALVLSLASVLGGKAQAMNTNKNQAKRSQSLGAVGGATSSNNSNLLAGPRVLKKSKSMSNLTKGLIAGGTVLGAGLTYEILGDTLIDKAPTLLKLIAGDNMKPEEKQALAGKILDVINTFDIEKIGKSRLPKYEKCKSEDPEEKKAHDKKYDEDCDNAVKGIKDAQGNSYIDRVSVKEYALGGVMKRGGVNDTLNKYDALRVFSFGGASHLEVLKDLQSWNFKNKYNKNDVKEITFAKNRISIRYNCDEFSWFELQEDGKLKVNFVIDDYSGGKKLITEFTLEKPKK